MQSLRLFLWERKETVGGFEQKEVVWLRYVKRDPGCCVEKAMEGQVEAARLMQNGKKRGQWLEPDGARRQWEWPDRSHPYVLLIDMG